MPKNLIFANFPCCVIIDSPILPIQTKMKTILSLLSGIFLISCYHPVTYQIGGTGQENISMKIAAADQTGAKTGFWIMNDGTMIHHFRDGLGKPVLVIHGGPGEPYRKPWEGLRLLSDCYAIDYYDQRGCGGSDRCIDRLTSKDQNVWQKTLYQKLGIETQLKDIEQIRQILGMEKIVLIGHSYGGVIAALYAIEFPDRVEQLILVSPAPSIRQPLEKNLDLYNILNVHLSASTRKEFKSYRERIWDYDEVMLKSEKELHEMNLNFFRFYDEYLNNIGMSHTIPMIHNLIDKDNIGGWLNYAYALSFPDQYDYRDNLKSIKAPTLIIWGDKDLCQPDGISDYLIHIPRAKQLKFKNCGHFPFEEKPEEFAEAVKSFLKIKPQVMEK